MMTCYLVCGYTNACLVILVMQIGEMEQGLRAKTAEAVTLKADKDTLTEEKAALSTSLEELQNTLQAAQVSAVVMS